MAHHLPKNTLPILFADIASHAKGGQICMTMLTHFFGIGPDQNINQMACAKAFIRAQHRRKRLAHGRCAVKGFRWFFAQIAFATILRLLPKILQKDRTATFQRLGQSQERIQTPMIGMSAFRWRKAFVDLGASKTNIVRTI